MKWDRNKSAERLAVRKKLVAAENEKKHKDLVEKIAEDDKTIRINKDAKQTVH